MYNISQIYLTIKFLFKEHFRRLIVYWHVAPHKSRINKIYLMELVSTDTI